MKNHFLHQKVFDEAVQQFNITLKYLETMLSMDVTTCNILQRIDTCCGHKPYPFHSVRRLETFQLNGCLIAKVFCILRYGEFSPFETVCVSNADAFTRW